MEDVRDIVKQIREAKSRVRWTSKTIKAETRQLRSTWTREMANEISVFSSIDAEAELQALLKKELGNEN